MLSVILVPVIPIYGRFTLLYFIRSSVIDFVELIGIAKPRPSTPVPEAFIVLMPITSPFVFTKAPPLFPELIAASV